MRRYLGQLVEKNWPNLWVLPDATLVVGLYMAKLESWTSIGAIVMGSLFVSMMISFYAFLVGPAGEGPNVDVDREHYLHKRFRFQGHLVSFWLVSFLACRSEAEMSLPGSF